LILGQELPIISDYHEFAFQNFGPLFFSFFFFSFPLFSLFLFLFLFLLLRNIKNLACKPFVLESQTFCRDFSSSLYLLSLVYPGSCLRRTKNSTILTG